MRQLKPKYFLLLLDTSNKECVTDWAKKGCEERKDTEEKEEEYQSR